ncbi:long-chain fatty acid--CoA ligase [soil metagenome]
MYVGDYLARRCAYTPDAPALVDVFAEPHARYTYRALNARADRLAAWLRAEGVRYGDRVALLAYDGTVHYDVFFACGKLGALHVPLSWRLHARELAAQIAHVEPTLLLHDTAAPIDALVTDLPDALRAAAAQLPRFVPLDDCAGLAAGPAQAVSQPVTYDALAVIDTACLLFTGGTTGRPKAAQISHRQIVWNTFNARLADVRESDVFLNIFPLFHAGGLFAFSVPLLILGGTVIQTRRFDAAQVLRTIEAESVTILGGVPTVFHALAAAPEWQAARLDSLRFCMSGGAPMPVPLIQRFQREKGIVFRQGFGMTEFGPGVFSLPAEEAERRAGSIGRPNFFVDARIVDPATHALVPAGGVGELMLRGPSATTGYYRDDAATAALFDAAGFLHTGDMARVDDDGFFYIVDRLKDMYISGGENVYPAEVEAALHEHPAVALCAVIGVRDERWGEVGCAFVTLRAGEHADEAALLAFLDARLARFKVPRSVVFRDTLPLSAAGKILRRALRDEG